MNKLEKWTIQNSYDKNAGSTGAPKWPHEVLVKLFSSKNYSTILRDHIPLRADMQMCEIGCMGGNNLRFFNDKGCSVAGIEVTQELVDLAQERCNLFGIQNAIITKGSNCNTPSVLPSSLDILISVNTLHYEVKGGILKALENFQNILKHGGVALIETAAPNHFLVQRSSKLDNLYWESKYDDFRKGDFFGFFDNLEHFNRTLKMFFSEVEIFTVQENYPKYPLEFFVALVKK
jgi:SAM-dependent methyltransferase